MMRHSSKSSCLQVLSILPVLTGLAFLNSSCASRHAVVASTGTMIGVEISENPANATLQAKLGYNRVELAVVPTNRSAEKEPGSVKNGATDSADVLMELRYGGIFDTGNNSGIYQRLAVGSKAVSEPGAAFMFAKGLDSDTAQQVQQALSGIQGPTPAPLKSLASAYRLMHEQKKAVFDAAAKEEGFTDFSMFLISKPSTNQVSNVRERLLENLDIKQKLDEIEAKKDK